MYNIPILRATALASLRCEDPVRYLMRYGKMSYEVAHYEITNIVYSKNKTMTYDEMIAAQKYGDIAEAINSYLNDRTIEQAGEESGE